MNTYRSSDVQSEACFEAMQIDWPDIRQQAIRRGVVMTRVAVRDFDHNDQVCIATTCSPAYPTHMCCLGAPVFCIPGRICYVCAYVLSAGDSRQL